jgi:hypothetical protein
VGDAIALNTVVIEPPNVVKKIATHIACWEEPMRHIESRVTDGARFERLRARSGFEYWVRGDRADWVPESEVPADIHAAYAL